jgi:hypothetical protein
VSPSDKSPVHFGRNAKNSELAASISSIFSKADAQISRLRVSDVPKADHLALRLSDARFVEIKENFTGTVIVFLISRFPLDNQPPSSP